MRIRLRLVRPAVWRGVKAWRLFFQTILVEGVRLFSKNYSIFRYPLIAHRGDVHASFDALIVVVPEIKDIRECAILKKFDKVCIDSA